jgi:hypothetical protein
MAVSDFWRDLAAEFRALPGANYLRGDWDYAANSGRPHQWRLAGASPSTNARFEALARRAASEMPNPEYSDAFISWLEAVRKNSHQPGIVGNYSEQNDDGSEGPVHVVGSLHNLCEESAIYCNQLESDARQKEFEEKQRNDPRNWSQFRQQYEASRSIREIISEPAERISEEWVRSTIARMQGIKPEDVTRKQIAFEVSGLLSSTKRHIEMIPSAPQEPPSIPEPDGKLSGPAEPKPVPAAPPEETVAAQLQRLRDECRWTITELAEAADLSTRQVARHLSGKFQPLPRNISAYERAFNKRLKRQVVIKTML